MTAYPRTTHALREALEARGFRPRKRHGQHFLTDPQAVDAIVRDADVGELDHVLEIGTGVGVLTHALAETGARVTSFEVDPEALALARSLRAWPARVRFVEGDALAGKHALAPALEAALAEHPDPSGRLLVVSNLPYGAGTPIVLGLLGHDPPPDRLVVMLQREVVEKMLAQPGHHEYGAPSVFVGLEAEGRILRRFGPNVFWPRPRVDSAVLDLVPRADRPLEGHDRRAFAAFVAALFSRRRKVLPTALAHAAAIDVARARALVAAVGLGAAARVEQAAPASLLALFLAAHGGGVGGEDG